MTGSASDPLGGRRTSATSPAAKQLADRFKDPDDPFKLVIVRDMWLTGFDAPSLHTMYVDKPMRGHGLMQAIARVNRVFRDKPGGLVVDYLGLADELRKRARRLHRKRRARATPPSTRPRRSPSCWRSTRSCAALFHGFDYAPLLHGHRRPSAVSSSRPRQEHVLAQEDGKERFVDSRGAALEGLRARGPRMRRSPSATRWPSSRP